MHKQLTCNKNLLLWKTSGIDECEQSPTGMCRSEAVANYSDRPTRQEHGGKVTMEGKDVKEQTFSSTSRPLTVKCQHCDIMTVFSSVSHNNAMGSPSTVCDCEKVSSPVAPPAGLCTAPTPPDSEKAKERKLPHDLSPLLHWCTETTHILLLSLGFYCVCGLRCTYA